MVATRAYDDEQARRMGLTLLRGGAVLLAALMVFSIVLAPLPLLRHFPYVSMLALHGFAIVMLRRGRLRLGVGVFAGAYIAVVVATMWNYGGVSAPAGFVLPPIVLFVGLTLGGRAAVAAALASSFAMLGLIVLEQQGRLPPPIAIEPARIWLVITTVLTVTGLMLGAALRVIRESHARAAAHEAAREELELHLQQVRRLEAVGQLAAGVAHDFNNILTVVFAEAYRLSRLGGPAATSAASLQEAAERASALTRQLLAFGRRQIVEPELLDLDRVIAAMQPLLTRFVGEGIRFEVQLAGALGLVRGDRTQIEQVLLNLVSNARDAMSKGGRLTMRTGVATPELCARCDPAAGLDAAVFVEVRDTGSGIPDDVRHHLFEPFFTTKPPGRGTGLGLSTVHGIVRQAGGDILVDSVVGEGTTFTVLLPIAAPARAEASPSSPRPTVAAAADIVIVDDDRMSRAAIASLVEASGHHVTTLGSAAEAIEASRTWRRPPDLLLTDVVMPDVSGPEMARRLRERFPTMKILFMSGHAEEQLSVRGVLAGGVHFIAKPLERAALLAKIEAVLASPEIGTVAIT